MVKNMFPNISNIVSKRGFIGTRINSCFVYKFKSIMGGTDFADQFRKVMIRYKRIQFGYNMNVTRLSAC